MRNGAAESEPVNVAGRGEVYALARQWPDRRKRRSAPPSCALSHARSCWRSTQLARDCLHAGAPSAFKGYLLTFDERKAAVRRHTRCVGGIPPELQNHRAPTGAETPAATAGSSLDSPLKSPARTGTDAHAGRLAVDVARMICVASTAPTPPKSGGCDDRLNPLSI